VQKNFEPVIIESDIDNKCADAACFFERRTVPRKFSVDDDTQETLISWGFSRFMFFTRSDARSRRLTRRLRRRGARVFLHRIGIAGKINRLLRRNRVFCVVL
jgi:hypothetical protein